MGERMIFDTDSDPGMQVVVTALRWEDYRPGDKPIILARERKDPKDKRNNSQWVPLLGESAAILDRQPRTGARIFPYKADSIGASFRRAFKRQQIADLPFPEFPQEDGAQHI